MAMTMAVGVRECYDESGKNDIRGEVTTGIRVGVRCRRSSTQGVGIASEYGVTPPPSMDA